MSDEPCSHGRTNFQTCAACELRGLRLITIGDRFGAHDLVEARGLLQAALERVDAKLRQLDGRMTAGNPSLVVNVAGAVPRVESEPR